MKLSEIKITDVEEYLRLEYGSYSEGVMSAVMAAESIF